MPDKLEERLVRRTGGWKSNISYADNAGHLINPDGPAALAEITRLKGEVERQSNRAGELNASVEEFRHAWEAAETALAAKQALIDELVEGLTDIGSTDRIPRRIRTLCLALISKARSSGKAGSDA